MKNLFQFLQRPFPPAGFCSRSFFNYFLVGVFVTLFLLIFQPFDINLWRTSHKTAKLLGFGLLSFLVPTTYSATLSILRPRALADETWTIGREILSITVVVALIAVANLFYSYWLGIMYITWTNFLNAVISVVLLGLFPITFLVLTRYEILFRKNSRRAEEVNRTLEIIPHRVKNHSALVFTADNGRDRIEMEADNLLYISSADNYSNIVFQDGGQIKRSLLRSSLTRLEQQVSHPRIRRCHRAWIVNLDQVIKTEGNAAGYRLTVTGESQTIPVSRNFVVEILAALRAGAQD